MPYVSHDIGSFAGKHLPDDLYLRWVQLGAFQPILRLHSDHGDRLPWEYSDAVSGPAADFLRLRESLVPYLYTAARQTYDTGLPMARALYLDWPERGRRRTSTTPSTCWATTLLVAPVTTPGLATTAPVWFPPGTWTDFFTGATFRGPATRTVGVTPDHMPVYVRAGGIVAQAPGDANVAGQPKDRLTLTVVPARFRIHFGVPGRGRRPRLPQRAVRADPGPLHRGPAVGADRRAGDRALSGCPGDPAVHRRLRGCVPPAYGHRGRPGGLVRLRRGEAPAHGGGAGGSRYGARTTDGR